MFAPEAQSYRLLNSRAYFLRICKEKDTWEWLENVITEGWNAYMVVGIHTVKDAEITLKYQTAQAMGVSGHLPVTALAGAAAGVPVPDQTADIKINGETHKRHGGISGFIAPGEQVIAIQYHKLKFRWLSSRSLESTYLEMGNRWKVYLLDDKAEPEEEIEDVEDVLEVEFEEEIESTKVGGNHEGFMDCDVRDELFLVQQFA